MKDACRKAGVSPRTYRDWKGQPEFAEALAAARKGAWTDAAGLLRGLAPAAVRRLRILLRSQKEDVALRAAVALLDRAARAVELGDLLERVDALEMAERDEHDRNA